MKRFELVRTPIEPGVTLIEASAGTGKTYTLTGLVLRLLLEQDVRLPDILVVTFTIAATDELKERIRARLSEALAVFEGAETEDPLLRKLREDHGDGRDKLRLALLQLDEIGIHTIHAFCKRALEDSAFESGLPFQAEFVDEEWALLRQCAEDFWRRRFYDAPPIITSFLQTMGWGPTTFLEPLVKVLQHVDPTIRPNGSPLDACLEEVAATYRRIQATLPTAEECTALVGALSRRKGKTKHTESLGSKTPVEELVQQVRAFAEHPAAGLAAALFLGEQEPKARGTAQKAWQELGEKTAFHAALKELKDRADQLESALRTAFFREVAQGFDRSKRDARTITFDDLLAHLARALSDPQAGPRVRRAIRSQFRVALIDEFQDTDARQWDIFSKLFADQTLFLIGDPKQAIYSFRGADVFTYLKAQRHADRRYGLTTNWRSRAPLLDAVNGLFADHPNPFAIEAIGYEPVRAAPGREEPRLSGDGDRPPLQWWRLPEDVCGKKDDAQDAIQRAVAGEVVRLLSGGARLGEAELRPRDIAILVRKNDEAVAMQEELRRANVPAIVTNTNDIYQSREMEELQRLLEAVHEPRNPSRLRAAWATELWGDDAEAILAVSEDSLFEQRVAQFEEWRRQWVQLGFAPMMFDLLAKQDVRQRLLRLPDGERRLTNLLHCIEIVHAEHGEAGDSPEGTLQWLRLHRHQQDHHGEIAELRLESDERAVKILTIHKSKGLEYEIVFCPFLTFHRGARSKSDPGSYWEAHEEDELVFDFAADHAFVDLAKRERLAEDLRLAYVAITRAKERCYLPFGGVGHGKKKLHRTPLGHLIGPALGLEDDSDPESTLARLEALVAANPKTMSLEPLPVPASPPRWEPDDKTERPLGPRRFEAPRQRLSTWRLASFSSLKTGADSLERPDHLDPIEPEATLSSSETERFSGFARGARAGICLHEIFEQIDFQDLGSEEAASVISRRLARFGLDDPARHPACRDPAEAVRSMLEGVVAAALPDLGWRLADLPVERRLEEWSFHLPIGELTPSGLAAVFASRARGRIRSDYAPRLTQLSRGSLRGFLHGFVDLVAEHEGRWYVFDWKSNHLGTRASDYGEAAVWSAMVEHHYVLQYHLYLVGLHRFLRYRVPDYDYDRYIGGVAYAFVRGIALDPARGWFLDRPSRELVEAIDDFLESGRA